MGRKKRIILTIIGVLLVLVLLAGICGYSYYLTGSFNALELFDSAGFTGSEEKVVSATGDSSDKNASTNSWEEYKLRFTLFGKAIDIK